MRRLLPVLLALSLWPAAAPAQKDPGYRSLNQPVEPFRILGNLYYVGASDVTSFLITTPQGSILFDGGFEETAPLIRRDLFFGSHGSFFDLKGKAERLRTGETPNLFIDPQGYREHVKAMEERYRAQLAKEARR
jgi:hypothetical protein